MYSQGRNQEIVSYSEQLSELWPEGITFYVVSALINLGQNAFAHQHVSKALSRVGESERADLLALEGFLQILRGNASEYLLKASEASRLRPTPHTLYHLGMALPELQAKVQVLQASLLKAEEEEDEYAEARNANALAVVNIDRGNYKEALGWVEYAHSRTSHPGLKLVLLNSLAFLRILTDQVEGVERGLVQELAAVDGEAYSRPKIELRTTLADLYQATGQFDRALEIYESELQRAPRANRSWLTHGCVRALCALDKKNEAQRKAEATVAVTNTLSEYHRQRARLALAISRWPSEEGLKQLLESHLYFNGRDNVLSTEAALHIAGAKLDDDTLSSSVEEDINNAKTALTVTGLRLLAGQAFFALQEPLSDVRMLRLFTLGRTEVYLQGKAVSVRRRNVELLTILVSRPSGYEPEELSEALYGTFRSEALRVELHRLRRDLGVKISSRPYRLVSPVWIDVLELSEALRRGRVHEAIKLYRGPLLPNSTSPEISDLRRAIEAELHATVLNSNDVEAIWELAQIMPYDLELWETLGQLLGKDDPRYSVVVGRGARARSGLDF